MISNKTIRSLRAPRKNLAIRATVLPDRQGEHPWPWYVIHPYGIIAKIVEDTLVLHVFEQKSNQEVVESFRYCICGTEVKLFVLENDSFSKTYLSNRLCYGYYGFRLVAVTKRDYELIRHTLSAFIDIDDEMDTNDILRTFDKMLDDDKKLERSLKKQKAVDEVMGLVPEIPKSFDKTVEKVMEPSRYGFFDRTAGTVSCSGCGEIFLIK